MTAFEQQTMQLFVDSHLIVGNVLLFLTALAVLTGFLAGHRAGSKAALPALPGGEISSSMMTTLTQQAIRAVPTPQIVLPTVPRASQAAQPKPRHQLRVHKDRRRQMATEEPLPVYTPAGPSPATSSSQSHPFSSQLLSSAEVEREGVSWLLLQGWEGYDSLMHHGTVLQTGSKQSLHKPSCCALDCLWLVFHLSSTVLVLVPCTSMLCTHHRSSKLWISTLMCDFGSHS